QLRLVAPRRRRGIGCRRAQSCDRSALPRVSSEWQGPSRLEFRRDVPKKMTIKDDLHHLVDELDEDAAREALAYLHTLGLPAFLRDAPLDDEPETDEERAAVHEARNE